MKFHGTKSPNAPVTKFLTPQIFLRPPATGVYLKTNNTLLIMLSLVAAALGVVNNARYMPFFDMTVLDQTTARSICPAVSAFGETCGKRLLPVALRALSFARQDHAHFRPSPAVAHF